MCGTTYKVNLWRQVDKAGVKKGEINEFGFNKTSQDLM